MATALFGRLLGAGALTPQAANLAKGSFTGRAALAVMGLAADEGDLAEKEFEEVTVNVSSTAIRSITYRSDDTITVEFNKRGTYTYAGSRDLFEAFISAPSVGGFFNEHFK